MTLLADRPATLDPIVAAIADAEGVPEALPLPIPGAAELDPAKPREFVIICYSGDLEKTWASLILA